MTDFATLVLRADTRELKGAVEALDQVARAGARAEAATDELSTGTRALGAASRAAVVPMQRMSATALGAARQIAALAAGFISLREVARMSAEYQAMHNSLIGIGMAAEQAALTLDQLGSVAAATRMPLSAMTQLYARAQMAAADLGASQKDLIGFTKAVGLALGQSGTSAQSASGALLQLAQALSSSRVQAEEWNSILEGAYPVALAAARGIDEAGGSVARLTQMIKAGEVAPQQLFQAILSQVDELEASFASATPTIGGALTVLRNELTLLFGDLDRRVGVSEALARSILWVADQVRALREVMSAESVAAWADQLGIAGDMLQGMALIVGDVAVAVQGISTQWELLGPVVAAVAASIVIAIAPVTTAVAGVTAGVLLLRSRWDEVTRAVEQAVASVSAQLAQLRSWIVQHVEAIRAAVQRLIDTIARIPQQVREAFARMVAELEAAGARVAAALNDVGQAIADGLGQGIQSGMERVRRSTELVGTTVIEYFKRRFGIHSPSRVMAEQGEQLMAGLALGMTSAAPLAVAAARDVAGDVVDTMAEGLSAVGLGDRLAEWVLEGFRDGMAGLRRIFLMTLRDMIMAARQNPIVIGTGVVGGAPAGGGFAPIFAGIRDSFRALGTLFTRGFGALGGVLSGIGAILPAIGVIGGIVSLFRKKVVDRGIVGAFSDAGFEGEHYVRRKGLLGSSVSRRPLEAEVERALSRSYSELRQSIAEMAGTLGLGTEAMAGFVFRFKASLKDMTEGAVAQELERQLAKAGEGLAQLVLATEAYTREGETALQTLTRLSTSLVAVNEGMDMLGHGFRAVGLAGADTASRLIDAFGGLQDYQSSVERYFSLFYSEEERRAILLRQVTAELAELNTAMPTTRAQYRALIESLDVTTESGRTLYATLIRLADTMDFVLPAFDTLSAVAAQLQGVVTSQLDATIADLTAAQRAAQSAASLWYQTATSLRAFLRELVGSTTSALGLRERALESERAYRAAVAAVRGGDAEAARDLPRIAGSYLEVMREMARSATEYARSEGRVRAELALLAGIAELSGAREDVVAALLQQQLDLLGGIRDYLRSGGELSEDDIQALLAQLGSLEAAIADVRSMTYDDLMRRIDVVVELLPTADLPPDVRALIAASAEGIRLDIDLVLRSDLPPDAKWLAIRGASQHIKTVDFVARTAGLPDDLRRLALAQVGDLRKVVRFVMQTDLPADVMRLALAGTAELATTVTAVLASDADPRALMLALRNVGSYTVAVMAALSPRISDDVRRIVFTDAGTYMAMIRAALAADISPDARRILLVRQGQYIANITGVLVADMPSGIRRLLLEANTTGALAITIATAFASSVSPEDRAILRGAAMEVLRTITAIVNPSRLSAVGLLFLQQLQEGSAVVSRQITGSVQLPLLSADALRLLRAEPGVIERLMAGTVQLSGLSQDALLMLRATSGVIERILRGSVDLSGLTDAQRALLAAITGGAEGRLTLGGTFLFDPSTAFAGWYERVTTEQIASPMLALRTALSDLLAAIRADTAQREAQAREARVRALVAAWNRRADTGVAYATTDQVVAAARAAGLSLTRADGSPMPPGAVRQALLAYAQQQGIGLPGIIFDDDGSRWAAYQRQQQGGPTPPPPGGGTPAYTVLYSLGSRLEGDGERVIRRMLIQGPLGGTRWVTFDRPPYPLTEAQALQQWLASFSSGPPPAFAGGGWHTGGLRLVGEQGPELEATGPARYWSADDTREMLGGARVVAELRELRAEVAQMREESRQLAMTAALASKRTADVVRRWDADGMPRVRP